MEKSFRKKIPPSCAKRQVKATSDSVGSQLEDSNESERLQPARCTLKHKQKIQHKQINYIATHNINSLLKTGKLKNFTDELNKQEILIVGLQEMRNTIEDPFESQGYRIYNGKPGPRAMKQCPQFGTGFIVNIKIIDSVTDFQAISPRIATLSFKTMNKTYTLINAHAPTNEKNFITKTMEEVDKFWDLLEQTINRINKRNVKILLGDFNAQLGKERKYKDVIGKWTPHKFTNKNGQRLVEICREHNLISKSTYFKRKPNKLKTWKHPDWRKGEWQLDHICMDKNFHKEIYNVKVLRGVDTGSDHYIVKIKIKFTPLKKKNGKTNKTKRKYDPHQLIKNNKYQQMTKTIKLTDDLEELVPNLKKQAENLAPVNPRRKHAWWTPECDQLSEERHQAWLKFQTHKTEENAINLKNERKKFTHNIRRIKRGYHKDIINSIEDNYHKTNCRNYYKIFGKQLQQYEPPTLILKDEEGRMAHSNRENAEIMAKAFNKLLNCEEPKELLQINVNTPIKTKPNKLDPPTFQEVEKVLKGQKNYKACGEDQVFVEMWKYASDTVKTSLHMALTKIWITERFPEHWTTAVIHPLHKKGDKSNPDNYRGISLLDCTYKILSKILYGRIKEQLEQELGEYQGGFRPWRSCAEQIISLKLIMAYYRKRNKPLAIAFIDFKKAYDCLHRPSVLKVLRNLGLHPKLIKLIQLTLTNTKSKVKFRGEISEPFLIKTGLRQGDCLSPLLFNCALEYIMREWYKGNPKNIRIGSAKNDISLNCLGFADDLALLGNTIQETRQQIKSLQEISQKIGLKISFEKTEIMLTDPPLANKITIGGQEIKIVDKFKYLGEIITYNLNEKPSWQNRIKKLNHAKYITKNTYNKKSLSIAAKLKHYKTVTQPEITYAAETIFKTTNTAEIDRILKIERKIIRTCINKQYKINGHWRIPSNVTVYKTIEPVMSTIRKKRISFFGHLIRTPENRISKKIIEKLWNSKSTIKWITEIKEDIRELQITVDDLKNKTKNIRILQDTQTRLQMKINKRNAGRAMSDEERKKISVRMKKYWADRRANHPSYNKKI